MSATTAAVLVAVWILGIGILAVYFEVESVHAGLRVNDLMADGTRLADRVRRWQMRYNEKLSPDVLEERLPEEFHAFDFPVPGNETVEEDVAEERGSLAEPEGVPPRESVD